MTTETLGSRVRRGLRKLRGVLGMGVTWGALWGLVGVAIGGVVGLVTPTHLPYAVGEWGVGLGLYGLVSGAAFATALSFSESRRTLLDLSLRRVAVLGVIGAVLVPPLFGLLGTFEAGTTLVDVLEAMGVTAFLGGTFAAGSVAAARGAERELGDGGRGTLPGERVEASDERERRRGRGIGALLDG